MKQELFLEKLRLWLRRDFPSTQAAADHFGLPHKAYIADMIGGRRKVANAILDHYGYSRVRLTEYVRHG